MKLFFQHFRHFGKACYYSYCGLKTGLRQTPFQQEVLLGILHFILVYLLKLPLAPALFLSVLWVLILAAELLNTGIEAVVDLASPEIHPLAKIAKDTASAAVGLLLLAFFVSWFFVVYSIKVGN